MLEDPFPGPLDEPALERWHALREGDRRGLEELERCLLPLVREVARLRLDPASRSLADRDDRLEPALERALRQVAPEPASSRGKLLYLLALRTTVELERDARRRGGELAGAPPRPSRHPRPDLAALLFGPDHPLARQEAARRDRLLDAALESLDGPRREVILLRRLCGLSLDETARELGLKRAATARVLSSRAGRDLERLIERAGARATPPPYLRQAGGSRQPSPGGSGSGPQAGKGAGGARPPMNR